MERTDLDERIHSAEDNPIIDLEAVTDEELATVGGGRDYGWGGGGWVNGGSSLAE